MRKLFPLLFILGFPILLWAYFDSFVGTVGTALATHDSNWASPGATYVVGNAQLDGSGHVEATGGYNPFGGRYTVSTNDTSQITVKGIAGTWHGYRGPIVRAGAATLGYNMRYSATIVLIEKNGVEIDRATGLSFDTTANHVCKIIASGTSPVSISAYVDGTLRLTVSDSSSPIASGNPGFYCDPDGSADLGLMQDWADGAGGQVPSPGGTGVKHLVLAKH